MQRLQKIVDAVIQSDFEAEKYLVQLATGKQRMHRQWQPDIPMMKCEVYLFHDSLNSQWLYLTLQHSRRIREWI